jgi:hypothetical protein
MATCQEVLTIADHYVAMRKASEDRLALRFYRELRILVQSKHAQPSTRQASDL